MNSHPVVRVPGCAFVVALLACIALQGCSGGADEQQSAAPPTNPPPADTTAPTIPQNVVATAMSTTRIDIRWDASTDANGVTGYRLYRNGSADALATVNAPTTSYSDTNLTANTPYSYFVRSFDAAGNQSAASVQVSATTQSEPAPADITAPSIPLNLVATAAGNTSIDLTWSASTDTGGSGLAGNRVYRNGSATALATVSAPATTFADTGLTASTQYNYIVRSFDVAGNESAASSNVTATTQANPPSPDTTAPTVPANVTATATSSARVNVAWSASTDTGGSGLAGYRLYRNGGATPVATIAAPTTTYADTGLTASTQYSYVVRAFDSAGNQSAASASAAATTPANPPSADTTPPTIPGNLTATAVSNVRINLSWSASTDIGGTGVAGYHIYRDGSATVAATVGSTSYADLNLSGSTQYTYVVKAFDVAGNESAASAAASATTQANPDTNAPSVPANVSATAVSSTRIDVSWSASTDAGGSNLSGYRVYYEGSSTVLATVTAPATTYADTGLTASTQYGYVVRAFDGAGNQSALSAAAHATTQADPVGGVSGLDSRPSNTTCLAWDAPATDGDISLEDFTSLGFDSAVAMLQAPADNAHWYVVQQDGKVRRFATANPAGVADFIDISGRVRSPADGPDHDEMGLLGMAFHPNFPTDRRVFLSYTTEVGAQRVSRISSFTVNAGDATADDTSEKILLAFNQPESNHKGGNIAFGSDGYLYIGFGDGGGGGDAHPDPGNGQRLTTLLGKMLRIDVTAATGYDIPATNPFAGQAKCGPDARASGNCPEIFAWGFRNPWRWSFDRSTGELWVGDVGQELWEEVDQVAIGGNYGWRCREGANDYASATTSGCGSAPLIDPVAQYQHPQGFAITGGYVYRGTQNTPLKGRFLFGDSGTGRVWAWVPENATAQDPRKPTQLLDASAASIVSFGQGNDGELYVVTPSSLKHIVFAPASGGGTVPTTLSATGCVNPSDPTKPASGLIPYAINAPFWSDGAVKERYIGLPDNSTISVNASTTDWDFPLRTVLMKNFRVNNQLIETRLFMHHPDGSWGGFSYEWNAQQTDATFVKGGAVRDIGGGQEWIFPSESQCVECHTAAAGRSLGLETRQLNRDLLYTQTNRTANELFTLNHIGVLSPAIPDPSVQPAMPDPADTNATLAARARAYLHTNCSQCHRPGGPTPSSMDLRYSTSFAQTMTCNVDPGSGDLGVANAKLIAPGSAANSILVNRMNRRDANGMPKLGSKQVDATGVALITQWINSLSGC